MKFPLIFDIFKVGLCAGNSIFWSCLMNNWDSSLFNTRLSLILSQIFCVNKHLWLCAGDDDVSDGKEATRNGQVSRPNNLRADASTFSGTIRFAYQHPSFSFAH